MRVDTKKLDEMFAIAGISREKLHEILIALGKGGLKKSTMEWSPERCTRNYCYVITELVHTYLAPEGSTTYKLMVEGDDYMHRFNKWPDGTIVDLTCDQFENYESLRYEHAVRAGFMHPSPSQRARDIASKLGLGEPKRGSWLKERDKKRQSIKELAAARRQKSGPLSQPEYVSNLPAPVIEEHDGIVVVRDDLLDGGSKRRFCERFVRECSATELVCGGINLYGKAQEALAHLCRDNGKACTLFVPKRNEMLPFTKRAVDLGANVIECANGRISVCTARARKYASEQPWRLAMPMGLDHPDIVREIARIVRTQIDYKPKEVWSVVSSGVLTRGLQLAWPDAVFYGVQTGHRVKAREAGRLTRLYVAPEAYNEKATGEVPPFPSLSEYDAKVWRFIKQYASKGALFWNVA